MIQKPVASDTFSATCERTYGNDTAKRPPAVNSKNGYKVTHFQHSTAQKTASPPTRWTRPPSDEAMAGTGTADKAADDGRPGDVEEAARLEGTEAEVRQTRLSLSR